MSDDDLQLNMREPIVAAAMMGMLLSGCSTGKNDAVVPPSDAMSASQENTTAASSMPAKDSSSLMKQRHAYKDGTFSAAGDYMSPSGAEEINVSLTLQNSVITDTSYEGTAQGGRSQMMQAAFGEGYKQLVIGKSIDEVMLDVVNGSSLTPIGFMDAVQKIKVEAAAS